MGIELKVEEFKEIEEGKHTASVSNVEERLEPFHYIDIYFKLESGVEIKYGAPATVSEKTKLGKLLTSLGVILKAGENIDLEKSLIGKKVSLMTMNETTDRGTFARIVEGSIRLLPSLFLDKEVDLVYTDNGDPVEED